MAVPLLKVPSHVAGAHWPVWCDGYKMAFQEMTGIKPTRKLLREFLFFIYKGHKLLHALQIQNPHTLITHLLQLVSWLMLSRQQSSLWQVGSQQQLDNNMSLHVIHSMCSCFWFSRLICLRLPFWNLFWFYCCADITAGNPRSLAWPEIMMQLCWDKRRRDGALRDSLDTHGRFKW